MGELRSALSGADLEPDICMLCDFKLARGSSVTDPGESLVRRKQVRQLAAGLQCKGRHCDSTTHSPGAKLPGTTRPHYVTRRNGIHKPWAIGCLQVPDRKSNRKLDRQSTGADARAGRRRGTGRRAHTIGSLFNGHMDLIYRPTRMSDLIFERKQL